MITSEEVQAVIIRAVEALNAERGPDDQIVASPSTPLLGRDSAIDSLGFVSVIADVETALNVDYDLDVSLAGDGASSRPGSPYASVAALRDYIMELVAGGR